MAMPMKEQQQEKADRIPPPGQAKENTLTLRTAGY